jgi:pyridoxal phosphate enzyme (YggS family)
VPEITPSPEFVSVIRDRIQVIRSRIEAACLRSGRNPESVQLLAVSKRQPIEAIIAAYQCGLRDFAENYAEEAFEKMADLSGYPDINWEMIGHIQSRKVKLVVSGFKRIQSVDSIKLASLLNRLNEAQPIEVLLEVNVSGEASKGGFDGVSEQDYQLLLSTVKELASLERIQIKGLMIMPPLQSNAENNRGYFREAKRLADWLNRQQNNCRFDQLSMGTSSDFEVAIEEGATIIRLGESIFGPRIYEERL